MYISTEALYERFLSCSGVTTDTRTLKEGQMFFALKGPSFNGNEYAAKALDGGASFAVVDEAEYQIDGRCLLVEDVLQSLQDLANAHRRYFNIPVLAITGSNGKTTTKELVHAVLSKRYKTLSTVGNLNNHIGVPLTLLRLDASHEMAVVEMGANHLGNITELCGIAEPTHGLITNIGKAHIGPFGGFEQVIRAKSELYHYLIQHSGKAFINAKQEILMNMSKRFSSPVLYQKEGGFCNIKYLESSPCVVYKDEQGRKVQTQLIGNYNFDNIAAACCIGKFFNVSEEDIASAVSGYLPQNNRSQVLKSGTNTVIMDAYNANPSSVEAALVNLSEMAAERKVVILGDMKELGENSLMEHRKVGELCRKLCWDEVFFCGSDMVEAHKACPGSCYSETPEQLRDILKKHDFNNSLILVKGSRGMKLEETVPFVFVE
ncbi:MAG: UDP-N-acetylmuramoyl-tripeptide--D-alanyl-D-alanine ligase [Cytophagales bacterium]|nr:UDP-N-acetylmuramoyl-tripeptide--D-alanyl-D-alanine ligase [Cytophagales bacterium]